MEANGLINSGMLGLEMALHPQQLHQQQQNPKNPNQFYQHPQIVAYPPHRETTDQHPPTQPQPQPLSMKQGYQYPAQPKQASPISEDDEHPEDSTENTKRKLLSPWHRMKWTDTMVRLLIMAVFYIGDEVGSEPNDPTGKKKAAGGGLLQKKGKWKSVSKAMMEKGFSVSPQQCEDKFNDLNKRYKRVNDILGKGTACRVVENPSLLETMVLTPKMKDEVKRLLTSKHLFFREMCAYHNSCGHGVPIGSGAANHSAEIASAQEPPHPHQEKQQICFHSSDKRNEADGEASKIVRTMASDDENEDEDESSEDEDEEDEEDTEGHSKEHRSSKRMKKGSVSPLMQQMNIEIAGVMQDVSKSSLEKKQWVKMRLLQLEEQQVGYQFEAFELEKQRLKWIKFSSKKEREMERSKLENERKRLETERMMLMIRQKELEFTGIQFHQQQQQHSSNKRGDPSSVTA